MDAIDLLNAAIERMYEGDHQEASHLLETLAEDILMQGCPDQEDLADVISEWYDRFVG